MLRETGFIYFNTKFPFLERVMDSVLTMYVLPAAFILDLAVGDPVWLPHPVRWMGRAITGFEHPFRNLPVGLTVSGILFAITLIAGTWASAFLLVSMAKTLHPALGSGIEIILIYFCISARCLEKYAMEVYQSLMHKKLPEAREKVSRIVGRDVAHLNERDVAQAAVESVAENLVDGVISPLFYAAIGGAPLALAYKMVNTLDSMVGYKNDRYRRFGKAAARIDDIANFIPARLSVLVISAAAFLLPGNGRRALSTGLKEGPRHTSPNSGYSEASFAGALGVKLGGTHHYGGKLVPKPHIGVRFGPVDIHHVRKACDLMILSSLLWLAVLWGAVLLWP